MAKMWLTFLVLLAAVPARTEGGMTESIGPHFVLYRQDALGSLGFLMQLEQIRSRLDFDLGMFWPNENSRIKVYLFRDRTSYLKSRFQPPSWSNGLAMPVEKTILVYQHKNGKTLLRVASHEMTHILFENYWDPKGERVPPAWLNEGVAMYEESRTDVGVQSIWHNQLPELASLKSLSLQWVVGTTPIKDLGGETSVGTWYLEAYSLVYHLLKDHPKLAFRRFCETLRQGGDLKRALLTAYGYPSVDKFEGDWQNWLGRSYQPSAFTSFPRKRESR